MRSNNPSLKSWYGCKLIELTIFEYISDYMETQKEAMAKELCLKFEIKTYVDESSTMI